MVITVQVQLSSCLYYASVTAFVRNMLTHVLFRAEPHTMDTSWEHEGPMKHVNAKLKNIATSLGFKLIVIVLADNRLRLRFFQRQLLFPFRVAFPSLKLLHTLSRMAGWLTATRSWTSPWWRTTLTPLMGILCKVLRTKRTRDHSKVSISNQNATRI